MGLQHLPKDLEPTLTQCAQGAMRDSFPDGADRCSRLLPKDKKSQLGSDQRKVDAISEQLVAVSTQVDFVDLAGLITHRSGSRYALGGFGGGFKESDRSRFLREGAGQAFLPRQEENQRGCYRDAC